MVYNMCVLYYSVQNNLHGNILKFFNILGYLYGLSPGFVLLIFPKFLLTVFSINVIAAIGSIIALGYHLSNVMRGRVCIQDKKPIVSYDNGLFKNLKSVFGERMYLAWLFPLIKSPLPEDGYSWKNTLDIKTKAKQNKL